MKNRAVYDYRALGKLLRARLDADPRGYREISEEVGCPHPIFSKVQSGEPISAHSMFAIADWLGIDPRAFYALECFTGDTVKQQQKQGLGDILAGMRGAR